jgi:hypothetical protein
MGGLETSHAEHKTLLTLASHATDVHDITKHLDGKKVLRRFCAPWADVKEFGMNDHVSAFATTMGIDLASISPTSAPAPSSAGGTSAAGTTPTTVKISVSASGLDTTVAVAKAVDALKEFNKVQEAQNKAAGTDAVSIATKDMSPWQAAQWALACKVHEEIIAAQARLAKSDKATSAPATTVDVSVETDASTAAGSTKTDVAVNTDPANTAPASTDAAATETAPSSAATSAAATTEKRGRSRTRRREKDGKSHSRSRSSRSGKSGKSGGRRKRK